METRQKREVHQIKGLVEEFYGLDLSCKKRLRELVYAKRVFSKICRDNGYIFQEIGDSLGCKHCNVVHHIKNFDTITDRDYVIYEKLSKIVGGRNLLQEDFVDVNSLILNYETKIAILENRVNLNAKTENQRVIESLISWDSEVLTDFIETRIKPYKLINKID